MLHERHRGTEQEWPDMSGGAAKGLPCDARVATP